MQASATLEHPAGGVRRRWFPDAIIAGFVAIGVSIGVLMVAFLAANGIAGLDQVTHSPVIDFSGGRPAIALALHAAVGLVWAVLYARFVEFRVGGPGWRRGLLFALVPFVVSIVILLPALGMLGWALSAGLLVPVCDLVLWLIYGAILGGLYDATADRVVDAEDLVGDPALHVDGVEHAEALGAAGIVIGGIIGAAVGAGLAIISPPALAHVSELGWVVALAVGGALAGGALGGTVGSFVGLPQPPAAPVDIDAEPDPFQYHVVPFIVPPFLIAIIIVVVSTLGTTLLQVGKAEVEIGPITIGLAVVLASIGFFVIGFGALLLASMGGDQSPSSRETVSHRAEH